MGTLLASSPLTLDAPTSADIDAPAHKSARPWRDRIHYILLAAIILIGAFARFYRIDQPPLWLDEAATFSRICGTYQELLDILQSDGFVPLHYQIYWVLAQFTTMTPPMMRLVPAIAGVAMIPAMYFLTRQIASRRVALLAAAFTCCSAYMMQYSRDAKMYMLMWCLITLNMGCFLWWLNSRKRIAWLAWIATGLAAVGTHVPAFIVLGIQPIILLSHRRAHWKITLAYLLGIAVIVAGPIGYYAGFNRWNERVETQGWDRASGLRWIRRHNAEWTPPEIARNDLTMYLSSWSIPRPTWRENIDPDLFTLLSTSVFTLVGLCALGTLPWKRKWRGERADDPPAQPWWRSFLWLSVWLFVPLYGFYCASRADAVPPWYWLDMIASIFGGHWLWLLPQIAVLAAIMYFWPRVSYVFALTPVIGIVLVLNIVFMQSGWNNWGKALETWLSFILDPRTLAALLILVPPVIFHFSAADLRSRFIKLAQLAGVCAAIFGFWTLIYLATRDRVPNDVWAPRYGGVIWPAVAISASVLLLRLPTLQLRAAAILLLLGLNSSISYARLHAKTEPLHDRMTRDVLDGLQDSTKTFVSGYGDMPDRYYLVILGGHQMRPREFRDQPWLGMPSLHQYPEANTITRESRNASVDRLIIWMRQWHASSSPAEHLTRGISEQWELVSEESWQVYHQQYWTKTDIHIRREYRRKQN